MADDELGSLTKEPPLSKLDDTIRAITPGMAYSALRSYARQHTHADAPGLLCKRFISLEKDNSIAYDHFLSLIQSEPVDGPLVRKVMYFLWAYRDLRIRRFICERVADRRGKWRVQQLVNKGNASFFEEWLQPTSARKARSNFEFFLVEAGIFDPSKNKIFLDLDDGWLRHAALCAAEHERDPSRRLDLLSNPGAFLQKNKWLALLNATPEELPANWLPLVDDDPLQDLAITAAPSAPKASKDWGRPAPKASGNTTQKISVDLVARERANQSHFLLEDILAAAAKQKGCSPKSNANIDMFFITPNGAVLAEIKSCTDNNFHSQVRKGISQLLEYRYLYKDDLGLSPTMLLVVETMPPKDKGWIVDYLNSLEIVLAWKGALATTLVSTAALPRALAGVIGPA